MYSISTLVLFLSLSFLLPLNLPQAEHVEGSIKGVIANEHNQPLPNALIYLKKGAELIKATTSDTIGKYEMNSLKADTYTISVSYVGYFKKEIKEVVVGKGKKEVDIEMKELRCTHGHTH